MSKKISWKISLLIGLITWFIGYGGILGIGGMIITAIGIVNFYQSIFYKKEVYQPTESKPIIRIIFLSFLSFAAVSVLMRIIVELII